MASPQTIEKEIDKGLRQIAAQVLRAYLECSDEVQQVIREMVEILQSPDSDDDESQMALDTIGDALFPGHDGDGRLGIDLEALDAINRDGPEAATEATKLDEEEQEFADRLAAIMDSSGITQTELAERSGVGQPAISMMLQRSCRPQRRTIERLAQALKIEPAELWPAYK